MQLRAISPVPPLPHPFLARPRLSMPAVRSTSCVKLFCAPAGTGKTVLLLECLQQLPEDELVVWIPSLATLQNNDELVDWLCHGLDIPPSKPERNANARAGTAGKIHPPDTGRLLS